ncbi:MAG: anaerobic ribonucleoside-triphosphate reductase activating protein [Ruminococcaceae bacterium]|jgi:anaerobic ribonucleoside-triphosphate reductase activating protein|nr:anaerobic ribonucleoside-triphosphate reductase activating protein [Oscillospiraceae bacterium]
MNYAEIKYCDIANGIGVRTSLFVSGCTHHCENCFNKETWDFKFGKPFDSDTEQKILQSLKPSYIEGLSLLGGEPFEPVNQRGLVGLLKRVKEEYPEKTVWCYTGYTLESDLLSESRARCEVTDEMLSYIDVLVDGEFVQELYDISLRFRGSSNQRLIDVKKTLEAGKTVLWEG